MAHVLYTYKIQIKSGGTWVNADKPDYPALSGALSADDATAWNNNWTTWQAQEQAMVDAGKIVFEELPTSKTIGSDTYSTPPGLKVTFTTEADKTEYEAIFDNEQYNDQLDVLIADPNCHLLAMDEFTEE